MVSLRKVIRRYRGGMDSNHTYDENYLIGKRHKLSLHLPVCNPPKLLRVKTVNFPIEEEEWFERNHKFLSHLKYVPIHEAYWYYMPLIPTPFRGELGNLRLNISISRTKSETHTPDELGQTLIDEYNGYYNSPVIGDYGLGHNTRIIQKVEEHSARRHTPFTDEEKKEQIEINLRSSGYDQILRFKKITVNDIPWVLFIVNKSTNVKVMYYSTILNDGYYLLCKFTLSVNMSDENKPWYKEAKSSISKLLQGVRLERH